MAPLLQEKREYTIEDIYALPDGKRAELIDGRMYAMTPPSTAHQRLVRFFVRHIGNHIEGNGGACEVFPAPFQVRLQKDNKTYVEPDVSVICDPKKLNEHGCEGAPDWVIEIVSPSSYKLDYQIKTFKYRAAGVKEYWIVDPDRELVTVHRFLRKEEQEYSFTEQIPVGLYPDLVLRIKK